MDHKPLEKLGHLHSNTMNRLQMALLKHNFAKRDQTCQLTTCLSCQALAFDPFQADLDDLQMKDKQLQMLKKYLTKNS
jgi:hypothetical protein